MRGAKFITLSLFAVHFQVEATLPRQEHIACLKGTYAALTACNNSAAAASHQANDIAVKNGAPAENDSLNQSADREAATTKKISDLLQSALSVCQTQAEKCVSSGCTAEYDALGQACAKDVGSYIDQLSQGLKENMNGNRGSLVSDADSTGRSGSGGKSSGGGLSANRSAAGSPSSGTSANSQIVGNPGNILQRNVAGDPARANKQNGSDIEGQSGQPDSGSGSRSGSGSQGAGRAFASASPMDADSSKLQIPGDFHETRRRFMRKALQGKELDSAILQYCKTKGAGDEECDRIVSTTFCASPNRAECPSCQKKSLNSYSRAEIGKVCVAACANDPQYGPQLADRCRSVLGTPMENEAASRKPASVTAELAVEGANGLSIFSIVSQTIRKRCLEGKLRCGF